MYQATTVTTNLAVAGIFYFFLALYAPGKHSTIFNRFACSRSSNNSPWIVGSVMMYSYMLKQRRKVLARQ